MGVKLTHLPASVVIAAVLLTAPDTFGQAAGKPKARVSAKAYGQLPENPSVTVRYRGDSELNLRLKAVIERELQARGYRLDPEPQFTLTFETLVEEKHAADQPARVVGRGGSRGGSEVEFQFRLPVGKLKPEVGGRRYSLNINLAAGKKPPIWAASAVAVMAHGDRFAVQSSMAKALVAALGQSFESRPFPIE